MPVETLRAAARSVAPLELGLTRVRRWEPEGGIYIDVVDPRGDLRRFRSAVLAHPDPGYHPHVTLLHKDSIATPGFAAEAWTALASHSFDAPLFVRDAIVYDEEDADVWREATRFRFGP